MKHRKRQFLIAVVIALTILLLFVGCKHAHQFEEAWQTNDNQHWKPCKCGEQDALSFHTDENEDETCDTCGYTFQTAPLANGEQMKNVTILKTASAGGAITAHPGGKITYTVAITNNSTERISVNVVDTLPEGTVFVDGCSNVSGKDLAWEVKNIFPGQTKTVSYTVKTEYTVKQIRAAKETTLVKNTAASVCGKESTKPADIFVLETFNKTDLRRMEMAIDALVTANLTAYNSSLQQHNQIALASMMYTVGFSTGLGIPTDLDEILTLIYEKAGENTAGGSGTVGEENAVAATNLLDRVAPTLYGGTAVPATKDSLFRGERAKEVKISDLISGDLIIVRQSGSAKLYIVDGVHLVELGKTEVIRKIDPTTVLPGLTAAEQYVVLRPSINLNTHYSLDEGEYFNEYDKSEYTELENALIKTAEAYLLRGDRVQYTDDSTGKSVTRAESLIKQPEDYTVDQYGYTNCAMFTYDIHWATYGYAAKATGTDGNSKTFHYTLNLLDCAKRGWDPETLTGTNKSTIYYYECPTEVVDGTIVSTLTEQEKEAIMQEYISLLRPGDVICYRYHPSTGSSGHAMLYVGNGLIIHSSGSNYSSNNKTDTHEASIRFMSVSELFDESLSARRYMFNHERFAIVRPQNLTKAKISTNTANRIANMDGIIAEKVSSTAMGKTASCGDEITYTFYIFNTNSQVETVTITDVISNFASFVSATDNGTCEGKNVSWSIKVPADTRIQVSYTIKLNDGLNTYNIIDGSKATINGVSHKCIDTAVANTLDAAQQQKIVDAVNAVKKMDVSGLTSVEIANLIYKTAFGVDNIFGKNVTTYADLLNGNGKNNVGVFNDTTYWSDPTIVALMSANTSNGAKMVAPGMYGGHYVYTSSKDGESFLRYFNVGDKVLRSRYYWEKDLVIGDIYLLKGISDSSTQESLYIYIGNDTFISLGEGHALFAEVSVSQRFAYSPASYWKYHAVLRPSIVLDI